MLTIPDLWRTMSSVFRFGAVILKDDSGKLRLRNAMDSGDVSIVSSGARFTSSPQLGYVWTSSADGTGSWMPSIAAVVGQALFTISGDLEVGSSPHMIYNRMGAAKTITEVFVAVSSAPSGSSIIVDIKVSGSSIFQAGNRPQIAEASSTGTSTTIQSPQWGTGASMEASVEQVGSGSPGSNITIHVVYQ
jgi:hypothetical protein